MIFISLDMNEIYKVQKLIKYHINKNHMNDIHITIQLYNTLTDEIDDSYKLTIQKFDNHNMILKRFSMTSASRMSLDTYFKILNPDDTIEDNMTLLISDIRQQLRDMDEVELINKKQQTILLNDYPLSLSTIVLLWLQQHNIQANMARKLQDFTTRTGLSTLDYSNFERFVTDERKAIRTYIQKYDSILNNVFSNESITIKPFTIDQLSQLYMYNLPNFETLLDIFDTLQTSIQVPFIALHYNTKKYYKVYDLIVPPDDWLNSEFMESREYGDNGIYIKVLNAHPNEIYTKRGINNIYTDAVIQINSIILQINTGSISHKQVEDNLFSSFVNLDYSIYYRYQSSIKTKSETNPLQFSTIVFSDLVFTDDILRYFIVFDEHVSTNLQKDGYHVYFKPSQDGNISNSLSVKITPEIRDNGTVLRLSITKARNIQDVLYFSKVFSHLLTYCQSQQTKITQIYENYISNYQKLSELYQGKPPKAKREKTSAEKLQVLREINPNAFGHPDIKMRKEHPEYDSARNYPRQCEEKKQPIYMTKDEANELIEQLESSNIKDAHDRIFEFPPNSGDFYSCDQKSEWKYPGPQLNKVINLNHPDNPKNLYKTDKTKSFKYLPCCFKTSQMSKKGSKLGDYLKYYDDIEEKPQEHVEESTYLLKVGKSLLPGQISKLPQNIHDIFVVSGVENITYKGEDTLPYIRVGVIHSPDSFIHCLQTAFNKQYVKYNIQDRIDDIMTVRRSIAEDDALLYYGKQELYNYSINDIKKILLDSDQYIDPLLFVSVCELYYGCNIFLYVRNELYPNGNIQIPNHSQVYLQRNKNPTLPCIMIMMDEYHTSYPYQCEIIKKVDETNYIIDDENVIDTNFKLYLCGSNRIYSIFNTSISTYIPITVSSDSVVVDCKDE